MGKCLSIPPPPEEQIEMKVIEETSDIISISVEEIEDSINSLNTEDYLEIERTVNELLEEAFQSDVEIFIDELLEENNKYN